MSSVAMPVDLPSRVHHLPAAGAVALATALLVLQSDGDSGRLLAVAVLQVALALTWVPATGIPAGVGAPVLGVAAAAGADALLVLRERPELGSLLAVPALGFLAAVLHQMLRPPPRRDVVGSLAGVLLLICAVCALAVLLRVDPTGGGSGPAETVFLVVGATLVVGHLVDLVLPRPSIAPGLQRGVTALVLSVLAGAGVALLRHGGGTLLEVVAVLTAGFVLATTAALVGLAAGYVVAEGPHRVWAMPVVQAVLPIAACAPVAFSLLLQGVI